MLASTARYPLALAAPHRLVYRVTPKTPSGVALSDPIGISGGNVSAQLASRVTRTASFTVPLPFFPVSPSDPLHPSRSIVHIEAAIGYPDGSEELFPVFTGRVYGATANSDGSVTLRADDLAAEVIAADFEQPENSQPGSSVVAEIERLILDGWEFATFGTSDVDDAVVPRLAWDDDRGKAVDDLATAVEGRWFTLGNGEFVTRRLAYVDTTPVVSLRDGPGGTITGTTVSASVDGVYNSVVVIADRIGGADPIRLIERNNNALSPYVYGGDFGKRVRKIRMQTASGPADAQRVARSQLEAASALTRQWQVECVADYRIEPGDVAALSWRGLSDVQILDSVTYPLTAGETMRLNGRSSIEALS